MTDQNGNPPIVETPTSILGDLVGEGKKFRDEEALARGKVEADAFIEKLKGENSEIRKLMAGLAQQVETLSKKAEFNSRLSGDDQNTNDPPVTRKDPVTPPTVTAPVGLSQDDVRKLMEQDRIDRTRKANVAAVDAALIKEFGAEASNYITQKALELGVTKEYLTMTAEQSPQALFNMIGFTPNASRNPTLASRQPGYSPSTGNGTTAIRDKAYYDKLMKTMGAVKFMYDKNIQVQLHKDMMALGDRWDSPE